MRCDQFEQRLQQVLDHRACPDEDDYLSAHARICPRCQRLLVSQRALFDGLHQTMPLVDVAHLAEGVVHRLGEPDRDGNVFRYARLAACVAVVLIVAAALLSLRPSVLPVAEAPSGQRLKSPSPRAVRSTAPPSADQDIRNPWKELRWEELKTRWHGIGTAWELPEPLETRVWVDQLAGSLRPLAMSVSSAFSVVRSSLDGGKDRRPGESPQARSSMPNHPDAGTIV